MAVNFIYLLGVLAAKKLSWLLSCHLILLRC